MTVIICRQHSELLAIPSFKVGSKDVEDRVSPELGGNLEQMGPFQFV